MGASGGVYFFDEQKVAKILEDSYKVKKIIEELVECFKTYHVYNNIEFRIPSYDYDVLKNILKDNIGSPSFGISDFKICGNNFKVMHIAFGDNLLDSTDVASDILYSELKEALCWEGETWT